MSSATYPPASIPHCPLCGYPLRSLQGGARMEFYCINESCRTQFVEIITKEAWVERRRRREARRREELEKATGGLVSLELAPDGTVNEV